jgi:uncharacterized damage-inducible protein DinB
MITPAYCTTMARYNQWINERLYAVCATLSDEARKRDRGAFFGSMHRTLNHLLWGDRIWLGRLTGLPCDVPAFGADAIADFSVLRDARRDVDAAMSVWAEGLTPAAIVGELEYRSAVDGKTRRLACALAVVHMFNHGIHHRGQLTTLISQEGVDPGPTDLPWVPGVVEVID